MREIRTSGSEGEEAYTGRSSLPLSREASSQVFTTVGSFSFELGLDLAKDNTRAAQRYIRYREQ